MGQFKEKNKTILNGIFKKNTESKRNKEKKIKKEWDDETKVNENNIDKIIELQEELRK